MSSTLLFALILSFEIYNNIIIPANYHITLLLKLFLLFVCGIWGFKDIIKMTMPRGYALINISLYILFVIISSFLSINTLYSTIQCLMLIFLIIFTNRTSNEFVEEIDGGKYFKAVIILLSITALLSCLGGVFFPSKCIAFEADAKRLHGVYGEPAHLGIMSGLNICFAKYSIDNRLLKLIIITLSVICLFFTGFRTGFIALVVTVLFMTNIFGRHSVLIKMIIVGMGVFLLITIFKKYNDFKGVDNRYIRMESVTNLSGRTSIWERAVPAAMKSPFGVGYCLGGGVLVGGKDNLSLFKQKKQFDLLSQSTGYKTTLHNGYVQALADLGVLGAIFYILMFISGIIMILKKIKNKQLHIYMCIFIFLTICNLTESTIMSPTSTSTLLFILSWFMLMKYNPIIKSNNLEGK